MAVKTEKKKNEKPVKSSPKKTEVARVSKTKTASSGAEKKAAPKKEAAKKKEAVKTTAKTKPAPEKKEVKKKTLTAEKQVPVSKAKEVSKKVSKAVEAKEVKKNQPAKTVSSVKTKATDSPVKETEAKAVHNIVEVTSPRKVVKKVKGYSKEDLEYFKKIILDKRSEILEQIQNLKEQMMDPTTGQYVNENSPYSLHMAEQGTDAMEREKIFLWSQREYKFLGYLDDALHRIDSGTYGICIECIDEPQHLCPTCPLISKDRLTAVPHSQLCLPVKQKQEKR